MLYSPLDTALLLVLLQPSGDGYFVAQKSASVGGGNGVGGGMAWVAILYPLPRSKEFFFLPYSPKLLVIWVVLLMQNVPLDEVLHFDLHAAILGWLLTAVQPKLQHPWHST